MRVHGSIRGLGRLALEGARRHRPRRQLRGAGHGRRQPVPERRDVPIPAENAAISSREYFACRRFVPGLSNISPVSGRQSFVGRIGRGTKPPPQLGQTLCSTVSTQSRAERAFVAADARIVPHAAADPCRRARSWAEVQAWSFPVRGDATATPANGQAAPASLSPRPSYNPRRNPYVLQGTTEWPAIRMPRTLCIAREKAMPRARRSFRSSRVKSPWPPSSACPIPPSTRACASRCTNARAAVDAARQYRARHQEGVGLRRRELRRDPLRGLWSGRRRGDRRSADRQPQPHRLQRALDLRQERRRARRHQLGRLHVRPRRRDRLPGRRWATPTR